MESSFRSSIPLPSNILAQRDRLMLTIRGFIRSDGLPASTHPDGWARKSIPRATLSPKATAIEIQNLGETDVPHRGRHAGESRLDVTVPGDGSGNVDSVSTFIDPQVLGFAERSVGTKPAGVPSEVGAADALPVRGDVPGD